MASSTTGTRVPALRAYFTRLRYHKLSTLLILASTLLLAYAYLQYTPYQYQSEGSLRLKQDLGMDDPQGKLPLSRVILQHPTLPSADPLETEIKVMRSRSFMLNLATIIYEARYDPKGVMYPVISELPTDSTLRSPQQIAEVLTEVLYIDRMGTASEIIAFRYRSTSPDEAFFVVQTAIQQFIKSLEAKPDVNDQRERAQLRRQIDSLHQVISGASSTMAAGKIEVDTNLRRLTQALTTLQVEKRAAALRTGILRDMIAKNQQALQAIQPGLQLKAVAFVSPQLTQLQAELSKAEIQKMLYMAESPTISPLDPYLIEINDTIQRLQQDIAAYAADLLNTVDQVEQAGRRYSQEQENQIKSLQQQRLSYEIELSHLDDRNSELEHEIIGYQKKLQRLPEQQALWVQAESEQQTNMKLRQSLEEHLEALNRAPQMAQLQAEIVDPAIRPEVPIAPDPLQVFSFALLGGLVLSLLYVGFQPVWQTRVDSIEGLNKRAWNVIALIPHYVFEWVDGRLRKRKIGIANRRSWHQLREAPDLIMATDYASPMAEPYRRLEGNLLFAKQGEEIKTIAITSPGRNEGKSSLAANLALAFAETGKEVVLVDLNFRQPAIHTLFGMDRTPGLQDCLQGTNTIASVLRSTPRQHLRLLTVGSLPTGLMDVSRNDRILEVLNELKTKFDIVIIDTPAFGRYADAAGPLATADGVLICARFLKTPWSDLDILKKNLNDINAGVSGVAITVFDPLKARKSYFTSRYFKQNYLTKTN